MELPVHDSTSGHLLVASSLEILTVATQYIDVHVIMETVSPHRFLWAMTISVRVLYHMLVGNIASFQMLLSGMAEFVRVVAHAASSTIHHGSSRT